MLLQTWSGTECNPVDFSFVTFDIQYSTCGVYSAAYLHDKYFRTKSAGGFAHQESNPTATNEHARTDHQLFQNLGLWGIRHHYFRICSEWFSSFLRKDLYILLSRPLFQDTTVLREWGEGGWGGGGGFCSVLRLECYTSQHHILGEPG